MKLNSIFRKESIIFASVAFFAIFIVFLIVKTSGIVNNEKQINFTPATNIAIINSSRLKAEALCFKTHEKLDEMLSEVISKMHDSEISAKSEYDKTKNNKSLSKKQLAKNIEKIEENWSRISTKYKQEVQNIKTMDSNLSKMLQKKLDKVISKIAKTYKIDVIINNQIRDTISVFYASKNVDITDLIIDGLNKTISSVNLEELK